MSDLHNAFALLKGFRSQERFLRRRSVGIATMILPLVLVSCAQFRQVQNYTKPLEEARKRCLSVPPQLTATIQAGIQYTSGEITLREAYAIPSREYEAVYFVSADLEGLGLDGPEQIATWAVEKLDDPKTIFSIDGLSRQFSHFAHAESHDPTIRVDSDGYLDTRRCTRAGVIGLEFSKTSSE